MQHATNKVLNCPIIHIKVGCLHPQRIHTVTPCLAPQHTLAITLQALDSLQFTHLAVKGNVKRIALLLGPVLDLVEIVLPQEQRVEGGGDINMAVVEGGGDVNMAVVCLTEG